MPSIHSELFVYFHSEGAADLGELIPILQYFSVALPVVPPADSPTPHGNLNASLVV